MKLDEFTEAYIEAMLWAETDNADEQGGEHLDANYGSEDLSPELLKQVQEDCQAFQQDNWKDIKGDLWRAGHDFWLTRQGHGSGFWDGGWPKAGERLTAASKPYGGVDLYVVDGQIHAI